MTSSPLRPNAVAVPTCGLQTLTSTVSDSQPEGEEVDGLIFGDVLAKVAQEPASGEDEKTSGEPPDDISDPWASTCVIPTGVTTAMTWLDVALSSTTNPDATSEGSSATRDRTLRNYLNESFQPRISDVSDAVLLEDTVDLRTASAPRPAPESQEISIKTPTTLSSFKGAGVQAAVADCPRGDMASQIGTLAGEVDGETADGAAGQSGFVDQTLSGSISDTHATASSGPAFALPIHITALETHLPAAVVRTACDLAASLGDVDGGRPGLSTEKQPDAIRVKIMTFDLHPAALGPLTVRMRVSGNQVDISIDTHSEDVRAILTQTRSAMVEALAEHGLKIEPPDIRLTASPPPIEAETSMSEQRARPDAGGFTQDQGYAHHDQRHGWNRHRAPIAAQSRTTRSAPVDADKRAGIYL